MTYFALLKILWGSRRLYSLFATLDSARRFPKMRDRSLMVKRGFPAVSFPVAKVRNSSTKGGWFTAWLGCWAASSPGLNGTVSDRIDRVAEALLTGERGIVFDSVVYTNFLQIKRVFAIAFVQHASGVNAHIVAE